MIKFWRKPETRKVVHVELPKPKIVQSPYVKRALAKQLPVKELGL